MAQRASADAREKHASSILVVEDEAIVAMFLTDLLEDLNYTVCGAVASGLEALELAGKFKPALAIVDVGLRGKMDGVDTVLQLRSQFGVPSILLSGNVSQSVIERAGPAEPVAVLSKPYTPQQLELILNRAFGGR